MSTDTGNRRSELGERKAKHLEICLDENRYAVEGSDAGFDGVRFVHDAMPELDYGSIDTSVEFLGYTLPVPLFISCMTGGSEEGFAANKELARAAQRIGIPVGMGSFRILFDEPSLFEHFHLRPFAGDVPVIGNIGSVQVRDLDHRALFEMVKRLELDALAVHMNPGQEIYQPDGDTDFRGIRDAFSRLCESSPVPVIAKETGFGVSPALIAELMERGAAYVDVAGSGGTNWVSVESYRLSGEWAESAGDFRDWGLPTALVIAAAGQSGGKLIASGGIRSGMDAVKSVALGAALAGTALPFIRAVKSGGAEAVESLVSRYSRTIRSAMLLTGSRNAAALRAAPRWYTPDFTASLASFLRAVMGAVESGK